MAARSLMAACLLGTFLPRAAALRRHRDRNATSATRNATNGTNATAGRKSVMFRQQMANFMDVQYHATMKIGGQELEGIVDTGSFELVVFSKTCTTCGRASWFEELKSPTYVKGPNQHTHAYGSGSCESVDARDDVQVGPALAKAQAMWLATSCEMPLLNAASFNAIVGVGPPGQPEFTAQSYLDQVYSVEKEYLSKGQKFPEELQAQKTQLEEELKDAQSKPAMLDNFGVRTFSTCFGRAPGSPAWLIWNDATREGVPGVLKVKVVGNITWSVVLEKVAFSRPGDTDVHVGCATSTCAAIVDTGTSLIGVPTEVFREVVRVMESGPWNLDCSKMDKLPDLVMKVGGMSVRLPPSAYIGSVVGQMREEVARFMHATRIGESAVDGSQCSLLLMDLGTEETPYGPMFILGMPFFREYYTTFDLGAGRGDRTLFLSTASEECEPDVEANSLRARSRDTVPRRIEASGLRVPHWLKRRPGNGI